MSDTAVKKILVVDDEEDALIPISNILRRANYQVFTATRGKQAVELALKQQPDLIILDIVLPDMGGSEVATILVGDPITTNIPIIFLTGILTKGEEESVGSKPDRRYVIAKPVTQEELLEAVRKSLSS
jgi:two-component system sensor histidine kinase/response regulator